MPGDLGDDHRAVVVLPSAGGEHGDVIEDGVEQIGSACFGMRFDDLRQSLITVLYASPVGGLGNAVGHENNQVSRFNRQSQVFVFGPRDQPQGHS